MKTCQILTAALLVTCLSGGESSRSPSPRLQFNFNKYVDTLVTKMRTSAPDMGLDPLPLPDVNKTLTVSLFRGGLTLTNGVLTDLSTIYRINNATATLHVGSADVSVELGFEDLEYKYDYAAQIMDIGPHGLAHGSITDLHVSLNIILDTSNTSDITVALQDLTLEHAGTITILLDGSIGVINAIVDAISNVITTILKDQILGLIQDKVESAVKSAVADLHFSI